MTENIKKLLELASSNEELKNKLNNISKDDLISLAKEHGITLTDADFEQSGELSDDELNAVAGGDGCTCAVGGGGAAGTGQKTCVCVLGGGGEGDENNPIRCACVAIGMGGQ